MPHVETTKLIEVHGIQFPRSQQLIDFAYMYAKEAHGDQKRKYTDEPYIMHPMAVAQIVNEVEPDCEMVAAAFLHDVIEDTGLTFEDIRDAGFMFGIAKLVLELTDISKAEDGNRAARKRLDLEHLAGASNRAKTIKLADLIHNSKSILEHDKKFAVTYMAEKRLLLKALEGGNKVLMARAKSIVDDFYSED